jgi:hypothetical protein
LVPEKYGSSSRPVRSVNIGLVALVAEPAAGLGGAPVLPDDGVVDRRLPVSRSQTSVVSRWLVMPMAAMSPGLRAGALDGRAVESGGGPDVLGVVFHPSRGREMLRNSSCAEATAPCLGRTGWRGSTSCPGRWRECVSCANLLPPLWTRRLPTPCRAGQATPPYGSGWASRHESRQPCHLDLPVRRRPELRAAPDRRPRRYMRTHLT